MSAAPAVVFIHGLAKKPPADKLDEIVRWGLDLDDPKPEVFGFDNYGIGSAEKLHLWLCYWADVFHVDHETELGSYYESSGEPEVVESVPLAGAAAATEPMTPDEAAFVERLLQHYAGARGLEDGAAAPVGPASGALERVPLPGFVKEAVIRRFAVEAYHYLFDKPYTRADGQRHEVRTELRRRCVAALQAARDASDRVVVVAHSMGTMIAYDTLRHDPSCPPVDGLITLGSPLGVDEVQDGLLPRHGKDDAFPSARLRGPWINIYDPLDPICGLDPELANDYRRGGQRVISDIREDNWGWWRHTITHYLAGPQLRAQLRLLAGL